jgi:hypothetical protein
MLNGYTDGPFGGPSVMVTYLKLVHHKRWIIGCVLPIGPAIAGCSFQANRFALAFLPQDRIEMLLQASRIGDQRAWVSCGLHAPQIVTDQ